MGITVSAWPGKETNKKRKKKKKKKKIINFMLYWQSKSSVQVLPNSSTDASMVPSLLAALQEYFPYWRFSTVRIRSVVSVNSSAVAK